MSPWGSWKASRKTIAMHGNAPVGSMSKRIINPQLIDGKNSRKFCFRNRKTGPYRLLPLRKEGRYSLPVRLGLCPKYNSFRIVVWHLQAILFIIIHHHHHHHRGHHRHPYQIKAPNAKTETENIIETRSLKNFLRESLKLFSLLSFFLSMTHTTISNCRDITGRKYQ